MGPREGQILNGRGETLLSPYSQPPKWRLDPLWGPFLVILSHFWPSWAYWGKALGIARSPMSGAKPSVGAPVALPRAKALDA